MVLPLGISSSTRRGNGSIVAEHCIRGTMRRALIFLVFSFSLVRRNGAFQPLTYASAPSFIIDSIRSIFGSEDASSSAADGNRRSELKTALLDESRSGGSVKDKRGRIERIIEDLAPLSPVRDTATSPLLQKEWLLEWTTEKEINLFSDWNISGEISQAIDGNKLSNRIEFKKGGFLGVSGELSLPDGGGDQMLRTNFVFSSATLDLGRWGSFSVPPIGEGWFETLYLDDTLRVDTNSRDDILICTPKQTY
mmetsp:Transcript_28502/g.62694  ORF Transcript_28502/g.62694 Transcript_28502/m.62694 type:complete len:251 (+) Transcript_28502:50-802(+)